MIPEVKAQPSSGADKTSSARKDEEDIAEEN